MGWGRRKREITHKITGTIIAVVLEIREQADALWGHP